MNIYRWAERENTLSTNSRTCPPFTRDKKQLKQEKLQPKEPVSSWFTALKIHTESSCSSSCRLGSNPGAGLWTLTPPGPFHAHSGAAKWRIISEREVRPPRRSCKVMRVNWIMWSETEPAAAINLLHRPLLLIKTVIIWSKILQKLWHIFRI